MHLYVTAEGRKIIYRYDAHDFLLEMIYDTERISLVRDPHSGHLKSVVMDNFVIRYQRNGPLITQQTTSSTLGGFYFADFQYIYDDNLRSYQLQVILHSFQWNGENISYFFTQSPCVQSHKMLTWPAKYGIKSRLGTNSRFDLLVALSGMVCC